MSGRDIWVCPECGWPISWVTYNCPNCGFTVKDDEEMEPYRVQWFFSVDSMNKAKADKDELRTSASTVRKEDE